MPAIVAPATATCVRLMQGNGPVPEGALQLISGGTGDLLDRLAPQYAVAFTGLAGTAYSLRGNIRVTVGQDGPNASILMPDAAPGTPEVDRFIQQATREMTASAGQKCTVIRRIVAPNARTDALIETLAARLAAVVAGDTRLPNGHIGALVSASWMHDVPGRIARLPLKPGACSATRIASTFRGAADPAAARNWEASGASSTPRGAPRSWAAPTS